MSYVTEADITRIQVLANDVRHSVVEMLTRAGSGHLAGSLGMADILAALFGHVLKYDPAQPEWDGRDRMILSDGYSAPAWYATMAHVGLLPREELLTLRALGSRLQGHPVRCALPGLETTTGPFGDGLTQAVGVALGLAMGAGDGHVYVVMSDEEQQCGITWEAVMFAGARKLDRITAIIDRNTIQASGATEEVLALEPLAEKYEAFNWNVIEIDGHNIEMFVDAIEQARHTGGKPTAVIAHTIAGKGVPEIEGDHRWHDRAPTKEEAVRFLSALTQERKLATVS